MVTLSLLRHAKSAWGSPLADDFDRPLNRRGEEAAPVMGRYIQEAGLAPGLVLCSPARRTRATLDLVLPALSPAPRVLFEDDLYPAVPDDMLENLRQSSESQAHVMIVAHNPGLQTLALALAGTGDPEALANMSVKFPTCALAVIDFTDGWAAIGPGQGALRLFVTPRALAEARA